MSESSPTIWAIVPAAGIGQRFGGDVPKQYAALQVGDVSDAVLYHTLRAVTANESIAGVAVALATEDDYWQSPKLNKPLITVAGGTERVDSVRNALAALTDKLDDNDWVLVHDAARPCLHADDLQRLIAATNTEVGGLLAAPVADTLKRSVAQRVVATVDRSNFWRALTPQMFQYGLLKKALSQDAGMMFTDESSAIEALGYQPLLVEGRADNIKITLPSDLALAQAILASHHL